MFVFPVRHFFSQSEGDGPENVSWAYWQTDWLTDWLTPHCWNTHAGMKWQSNSHSVNEGGTSQLDAKRCETRKNKFLCCRILKLFSKLFTYSILPTYCLLYSELYREWLKENLDTTLKFSKTCQCVSRCAGYSCDTSRCTQHHVNEPSTQHWNVWRLC